MTTIINVIPSTYTGNPQNALGYAWQDYSKKIPGNDVIVQNNGTGIDYKAAVQAKMIELGITQANYNCMWCGGASGSIKLSDVVAPAIAEVNAGEEYADTAAIVSSAEKLSLAEQDERHSHSIGWCNKCHSYCFGDCESN